MIIQNGTIEEKLKTGGGIDPETGYPIPTKVSWGNPIPCQFIPNNVNKRGMVRGEHYTIASYQVLIEEQPCHFEQLRLRDMSGAELGEFSVISVRQLEAVCEVEILI